MVLDFLLVMVLGVPDLSITQITDSIIVKKEVTLLNNGKTQRDYTYIDDTVDGIIKCLI